MLFIMLLNCDEKFLYKQMNCYFQETFQKWILFKTETNSTENAQQSFENKSITREITATIQWELF